MVYDRNGRNLPFAAHLSFTEKAIAVILFPTIAFVYPLASVLEICMSAMEMKAPVFFCIKHASLFPIARKYWQKRIAKHNTKKARIDPVFALRSHGEYFVTRCAGNVFLM